MTLKPVAGGESIADLDSTEKNWGGPQVPNGQGDIRLSSAGPNTDLDSEYVPQGILVVPSNAPVAYATCHDATGYTDRIPGTQVAPRLKLCVYTTEKRYAMLVLKSSDPSHGDNGINSITFDITTWEPTSGA